MAPTKRPQKRHTDTKHNNVKQAQIHKQPANARPGVQKLKSSIRQTKRLLAKDSLDAALRVKTERRLRALEGELDAAEQGRKERDMAVRYHMVKFFERRKIERALARAKRSLAASASPQQEQAVYTLRVDLNYILHYPKSQKYISLLKDPGVSAIQRRDEVLAWVREEMKRGGMSTAPEEDKANRVNGAQWKKSVDEDEEEEGDGDGGGEEGDPEDAFFSVGTDEEEDVDVGAKKAQHAEEEEEEEESEEEEVPPSPPPPPHRKRHIDGKHKRMDR